MKLLSCFFPIILLGIVVLALPTPKRHIQTNTCASTNSSCAEATTSSFSFRKALRKTIRQTAQHVPFCPSDLGTRLAPTSHILRSDVRAPTFSESRPVDSALFGSPRRIKGTPNEMEIRVHPRLLMGPQDWANLIASYADQSIFHKYGSWTRHIRNGGINDIKSLSHFTDLEKSGRTSAYDGRAYDAGNTEYARYRAGLADLASAITQATAHRMEKLPICVLWADVAKYRWEKGLTDFLQKDTWKTCLTATLAWSKVVLAHHQFHCHPKHTRCTDADTRSDDHVWIWDLKKFWGIGTDWRTGGVGLALAYDLLYDRFTEDERITIRSAIALIVKGRFVWGSGSEIYAGNPNAETHPHRMFTNWAGYNGHLYVTNLAIEGEEMFDPYVTSVFQLEKIESGFNKLIDRRYSAVLKAFMDHSFYPDGATFEDAYSYNNAMREGSFALVASERRGSNVLSRARFRNAIHNFAQMVEPWQCGDFIGHASGGGTVYNAHIALFRYVYPRGQLPGMLWRQRYGDTYDRSPCRTGYYQSAMQVLFLGGEHTSLAEAPQDLPGTLKKHFPLSFYSPRRGILIARSTLSENASYIHFDCRPDAFLVGHDNADRGVFTYTVHRKTWIVDLGWYRNRDSKRHSLLHIDGLAEGDKAPSCNMTKVSDDSKIVIASGDLTYAYNTLWHPNHRAQHPYYKRFEHVDPLTGARYTQNLRFDEPELHSPWDLGWPKDDRAKDIGFYDGMPLHNVPHIGFGGLYIWKRKYRAKPLRRMTRSVALVRAQWSGRIDGSSFVVVDSADAGPGNHNFTSYLMVGPQIDVDKLASVCNGGQCRLLLRSGEKVVALHAISTKPYLSYVFDKFDNNKKPRIRFFSEGDGNEEVWMTFRAQGSDVKGGKRLMTRFGHPGLIGARFGAMRLGSSFLAVFDGVLRDVTARLRAMQPIRPRRLTAWRKRRLSTRHFTSDRSRFVLRVPESSHEFVGIVYGAASGRWGPGWRDVINTCFDAVQSWVTVFDCGTQRKERKSKWENRRCKPVVFDVQVHQCASGGVRWSGKLQRFRGYYVVVAIKATARPAITLQQQTKRGSELRPIQLPAGPQLTGAPPMLRTMLMGEKYTFFAKDFETRAAHQFQASDAAGQIALKFQAGGSEISETQDALMTCSDLTMAGVEITVYDCGDSSELETRYKERKCELIEETSEWDRCRGFRARIKVSLEQRRWHVAIVSAFDRGDGLVVSVRQMLSMM